MMSLDSGNTHCPYHYGELLESIISKYKEQLNNYNLILRTNSGFDSSNNIEKSLSIPKLKFIIKGIVKRTSEGIIVNIPPHNTTGKTNC